MFMSDELRIYNYAAVFDPAQEGGFNVSFPSLPGCVTFGSSLEEAKEKAREVLGLWLEELAEHKEEIPQTKGRPFVDDIQVRVRV